MKKIIKRYKDKIQDVASTIMASPSILTSKMKQDRADRETTILKEARMYDNAPDFDDNGKPSDAFKTRVMAREIKDRIKKRYNK